MSVYMRAVYVVKRDVAFTIEYEETMQNVHL